MKKFIYYPLVLILLLFAACNCDETVECNAVSQEAMSALPDNHQSINFTNGADSTITFFRLAEFYTKPSIIECRKSAPFGGCECDVCPTPYFSHNMQIVIPVIKTDSILVRYTAGSIINGMLIPQDTSFYQYHDRIFKRYNVTVTDRSFRNETDLHYHFLDVDKQFTLLQNEVDGNIDNSSLSSEDRLLSNYTTPEKTYNGVLFSDLTKRDSMYYSLYVSKIYYSLSEGVIAFEDRDGEQFYRSD